MSEGFHLSDQELLQALDGELAPKDVERVQSHLKTCWNCRTRQQEIEATIGEFIRMQRGTFDPHVPSPEGPRALLKAQLAALGAVEPVHWSRRLRGISERIGWVGIALVVVASLIYFSLDMSRRSAARALAVTVPNPSLTPGATVLLSKRELCRENSGKNKLVPVTLQRQVFAKYGIRTAAPDAYEVDYLITPALGGADDIRNLWPESRHSAVWNAQVKDQLEDHLRDLVCDGQLDLATAQREIAGNWIEAYKKYFHRDQPFTASP